MPNQHKWPQHSLRIAEPRWERVKAFAQRTGQTVTAVFEKAVDEYLDRNERSDNSDEEERG